MFKGHATAAGRIRSASRVLLTAGAISMALSQSAPAGGYVAPVIEYPVDITPIRGVTAPLSSNTGLWLLGGAAVLCLIFCFGGDDRTSTNRRDDTDRPRPPGITPIPETPAPVPLPGALIGSLTATGALVAIRRRRRKS